MFGDRLILEEVCVRMDDKRRIVIPKFTGVTKGDKLAFFYTSDFKGIKAYNFADVQKAITKLYELLEKNSTTKMCQFAKTALEKLELYSAGYGVTDMQGRLTLPSCASQKINLGENNELVFVAGTIDSIEIYPNQESYIKSKQFRTNNNVNELRLVLNRKVDK